MFQITSHPIDVNSFLRATATAEDGGVALFVGMVRRHSQGDEVSSLTYETYAVMATESFRKIAEEAKAQWGVERLTIVHRVGKLLVGEIAVVVVAASPHRREAFAACRFAIDRLKEISPIWKKEALEVSCV